MDRQRNRGRYIPNHAHVINDPNSTELARLLAGKLHDRRMSLSDFENETHIDHTMASKVLGGTRSFSKQQIPALAKFLEVEPEDVALLIAGFDPEEFRKRITKQYRTELNLKLRKAVEDFWLDPNSGY